MVSITQRLKGILRQRPAAGVSVDYPLRLRPGGSTARIALSNRIVAEDEVATFVVGLLSVTNGNGVYAFTITADPDSKFAIDNDNELQLANALDYETDTSHSVTIEADNGVDDPISRTFTITVTNVIEAPVFTSDPAVTGDLDGILTCSTGVLALPDGAGATLAYQWKDAADDSDLTGETANTLDTQDHTGLDVYCTVTATNSADSTAANSNTVGPLEEADDEPGVAPTANFSLVTNSQLVAALMGDF